MALKGYDGSVTVGGTAVGTAKIWSLDITANETDDTTFADGGWSSSCAGLKQWGGSITVVFDAGVDAGEAALIASIVDGTEVALVLNTGAAAAAGTAGQFLGNAVVTSMPITNDVSACIEVTFAFSGRGALTVQAIPV